MQCNQQNAAENLMAALDKLNREPEGAPESGKRAKVLLLHKAAELGDPPGAAQTAQDVTARFARRILEDSDAGRIVASVLESFQAFQQNGNDIPSRYGPDYAAHTGSDKTPEYSRLAQWRLHIAAVMPRDLHACWGESTWIAAPGFSG